MADLHKSSDPSPFAPPAPPAPYGAPTYGAPTSGAPTYGAPAPTWGPTAYGPPVVGAPAYGPSAYGPPVYGAPAHGQPEPGADPGALLTKATGALQLAAALLWALLLAWLLFLAAGIAYAVMAGQSLAPPAPADRDDTLLGLGLLLYLGLGIAVWVLVGLWTSAVGRACRAAGNGRGEQSSMAWWGLFVPLAGLALPLLAYREAAAYVQSGRRVGGPGWGRGPWWRREPVPGLLGWWWGLWAVAAVAMLVGLGAAEDALGPAAASFLLTALCGLASSVCGAVVLRRLAAATAACAAAYRG